MIQYIVECIAFQLLFLVIYDLFLRRETFFQWNRMYLITTYVLSLLLPWIRVDAFKNAVPEHIMYYPEMWMDVETAVNSATVEGMVEASTPISWWKVLFYAGMVLALALFLIKIIQLYRLRRKGEITYFKDFTRVLVSKSNSAFSFFRTIFLGDQIQESKHQNIVEHELIHIKQKHTVDLLLFELFRIVNWFNPLVYVYQSRISELHEFIADAHVAKTQKKDQYQLLLSQVFQTEKISFINHFFKSSLIKKRIVMLQKARSKKIWGAKYLLLAPMVLCILFYTSSKGQEKEIFMQEQTKSDAELIREINLKIDQLQEEKGSIYDVYYTSEVINKDKSNEVILNKKDFFEKNLIFKRYMNRILLKMDNKKVEIVQKIEPSTDNYNNYASRKKTFQQLDKNLKISFNQSNKVEIIESNAKISSEYKIINVENAKDLTGLEIKDVNNTIDDLIQDNSYKGIVVTDGILAVQMTYKEQVKVNDTKSNVIKNQQDPDEVPFSVVDNVPVFPGCEDATDKKACFNEKIQQHIRDNFRYPIVAQEQGIQGRVSIMFTIMEDGNIERVRMRGPSAILEQESARIIKELPKMQPGKHKGKKVRVPFSVPITFKLKGDVYMDVNNTPLSKQENQKKLERIQEELKKEYLILNSEGEIDPKDAKILDSLTKLVNERMVQLKKESREKEDYGDDVPFSIIEEAPVFLGCEDASDKKACFNKMLQKHIKKHFRYPKEAQAQGIQGRVSVMFTIGKDGSIKNIRKRGPSKILEQEAVRIIEELPQMVPGKHKGKNVTVPFSVPITFKLHDHLAMLEDLKAALRNAEKNNELENKNGLIKKLKSEINKFEKELVKKTKKD